MLAEALTRKGAVVHRITVVDDTSRAIEAALGEALDRRSHLVVTTGGLGPGSDDRTLDAIASVLTRPLTMNPEARRMVESAYRRLHEQRLVSQEGLNVGREKMCAIPVGAEPILNPVGAAPGILLRLSGGGTVLALPGVPDEARAVFDEALPKLRDLFSRGHLARREVDTPTRDESVLGPLLERLAEEFPGVRVQSRAPGFERRDARITVTLETTGPTRKEAELLVEGALRRLIELAGGKR
jgi:nicotinamide-nucleotide amidase